MPQELDRVVPRLALALKIGVLGLPRKRFCRSSADRVANGRLAVSVRMGRPGAGMQTLPTGTVSFLFTDIEGSTETLQAPQGELEIALRQPVQVQVRDQRVDLRRAAGQQREGPACKPLFHPPHPPAGGR